MKKTVLTWVLLLTSPIIYAEQPIFLESYVAHLSYADHYSSSGKKLTSVAAIIQQDRANFHKFGIKDKDDKADLFFEDKANRMLVKAMLNRGFISDETTSSIMSAAPIVTIDIYSDHLKIHLQ